jgi:O-antigen/teichoic acid export membrane protein
VQKSLLKSTFIYTILGFLPLSFGFIFTPIYTYYLVPDQMGILNLFGLIGSLAVGFYGMGLDSAFSYVYFDVYEDRKSKLDLLYTTLVSIAGVGLVMMFLFLLAGYFFLPHLVSSSRIFTFMPYWILASVFPIFTVYYNVFIFFFRNENDIFRYALLNVSTLLAMTGGSLIGVVWLRQSALGSILGKGLGQMVPVCILLVIFFYKYRSTFQWTLARRAAQVGFPIFIYLIIGQLSISTDRIIVERFFKLSDLGLYGVSLVLASVGEIWIGAVSNALSPYIYRLMREDIEGNAVEIRKTLQLMYLSIVLVIVLIIAVVSPAVHWLLSDKFQQAVYLVPILAAGLMGRGLYISFITIHFSYKKTNYLPYLNLIALVTSVIASLLFIPFLGVTGVALALALSRFSSLPVVLYLAHKTSNFRFGFRNNIFITVSILLAVGSIYLLFTRINQNLLFTFPLIAFILIVILLKEYNLSQIIKKLLKVGHV